MARTIDSIAAFLGAGALVASLGGSAIEIKASEQQVPIQQEKPIIMKQSEIPSAVLVKYRELINLYGGRAIESRIGIGGARLSQCIRGSEKMFQISGLGGLGEDDTYYANNGRRIGSYYSSDAVVVGVVVPKPPVNIKEYKCTTIKVLE